MAAGRHRATPTDPGDARERLRDHRAGTAPDARAVRRPDRSRRDARSAELPDAADRHRPVRHVRRPTVLAQRGCGRWRRTASIGKVVLYTWDAPPAFRDDIGRHAIDGVILKASHGRGARRVARTHLRRRDRSDSTSSSRARRPSSTLTRAGAGGPGADGARLVESARSPTSCTCRSTRSRRMCARVFRSSACRTGPRRRSPRPTSGSARLRSRASA